MAVVEERYAGALLEIAVKENLAEKYLAEAIALKEALSDNPELLDLYLNPKITLEEKLEVTENCFKNRFSDDLVGLISLIVTNGRSSSLCGVLDWFISHVKEYLKIGTVYVESACELDETRKNALEKKILQTTDYVSLEIHYTINKELIGGMKVRIKDRIIDNSIKTKLEEMGRELRQVQL
ncbi:MAG: ATP synthase F1 subunit delta [Lachnospiraceae bacterium]